MNGRLRAAAKRRAEVVLPAITYPPELPVSARRDDIARAIERSQVVVIAGETGSGKTTQIPKILLEMGRGRAGQIGHTQPRRIAARSVAERIAFELGTPLGEIVGYQVRFTDVSSANTLVKVMTDGILLAAIQRDPDLLAYDTIVIDEAHERSLNIDFLLGYLTRLLPRRPDLKVVITSATIDSERFAAHFSPARLAELGGAPPYVVDVLPAAAPVIEVTGRTYPVEVRYRPLVPEEETRVLREGEAEVAGSSAKRHSAGRKAASQNAPKQEEIDLVTGIIEACDELMREGPGDILVFLSGEREIHDAADGLQGHLGSRTRDDRRPDYVEIVPLYSRLSAAEQHRVFSAHPGRRIVLSTNVAETSLTVPGIRFVVDTGLARISRYSKATKVQRLPIEAISQASANQRSGRCGRVADGIAIRLYSGDDFASRPEFTEPEILRTSLASVLLQMIAVGVVSSPEEMATFPFVDPPDTRAVRDGVVLLRELGALESVDSGTRLTNVGRKLAKMPLDPRLARMIIEGAKQSSAYPVAVIAAALSLQDVRERPAEQRERADQLHSRFVDPSSDFLSYLNLWEYLREQQRKLSGSAFRRMCKSEFLHFLRIREWQDVVSQLRDMARDLDLDLTRGKGAPGLVATPAVDPAITLREPQDDKLRHSAGGRNGRIAESTAPENPVAGEFRRKWDSDTIHKSLLSGMLSQIGMQETGNVLASSVAHLRGEARARALRQQAKKARNEYLGARGARFAIFPGSPLSKKPPAWIMAGELVETSRLWARDVARIEPEWAEPLAAGIAKRTYSDPHWSKRQGAAMATEKVLLYGVPIVADRAVLYARIDAPAAREMFIRHALVQGEWTTHHAFWKANAAVMEEAEQAQARSRQAGLIADDEALFDFFDERLPESIVSARHFDRWWGKARRNTPDLLTFTLDFLLGKEGQGDDASADGYPDHWPQGELSLPLTYQFNPGTDSDGITVHIPLAVLPRVVPNGFDWLVPGMLEELCIATIRSLPKASRVQLVPAPDVGALVAAWLRAHTPAWADMARAGDMAESFASAFRRAVREVREVVLGDDDFGPEQASRLPAHLRVTFAVGSEVSGDLLALQRRLAPKASKAVSDAVKGAVGRALEEASRRSSSGRSPHVETTGDESGVSTRGLSAATQPPASQSDSTNPAGGPEGRLAGSTKPTNLTEFPAIIPDMVDTTIAGGTVVRGYPSLVAEADGSVSLAVLPTAVERDLAHPRGVRQLLLNANRLSDVRVTSRWEPAQALTMAASPYPDTPALVTDLHLAALAALTPDAGAVRDAEAYEALRAEVRQRLEDEVYRVAGDTAAALTAARELQAAIKNTSSLALLATLRDIKEQVEVLIYPGFVAQTPPRRLPMLVRFLRAASSRLEKAAANSARDGELAWRVREIEQAYREAKARLSIKPLTAEQVAELGDVRWLIEELRVSFFAQQLGTDGAISEQRIRKALAAI